MHNSNIMCLNAFSLCKLTKEQALRRSYYLYDRNRSGRISREEMLDALRDLGKIPNDENKCGEKEKKEKVKIPDEVENLFSLMDFANDNRYLINFYFSIVNVYLVMLVG